MAGPRLTAVCRDCGEVMHVDPATQRSGSQFACPGCGLLATNLPTLPPAGRGAPPAGRPSRAPPKARPR